MASLAKLRKIINPLASKNTGLLYNIVRPKVYTNSDWMPGPYPKTEAERKAAAEKYGLSPEEYEPYPDDGNGHGDYPKLPLIGRAARDPYYPWDDPTFRRNLNEPLHKHDNIIGEDRYDAGKKPIATAKTTYCMFFGALSIYLLGYYIFKPYSMHHPVMEKQLPASGAVHYTFEPAH